MMELVVGRREVLFFFFLLPLLTGRLSQEEGREREAEVIISNTMSSKRS